MMHNSINTNTYIIQVQWQNKYFAGNIYNKITKTRKTRRKHFVKCTDVSNITYIELLFQTAQPPYYLHLIHHIIPESLTKEMVLLLMILFPFRFHVAEKSIVGHRDLFIVIVNLFPHPELLMYAKPISFPVGNTNMYGIIFYQIYLQPCLNNPPPLFFCV